MMVPAALALAFVMAASAPSAGSPVNRPLTPDEVAMILGTMIAADLDCDLKVNDGKPMAPEVAKLGQDVNDFMPGGRYEALISPKIDKAKEWIVMRGKDQACDDFKKTLEHFLPGIF